MGSSPSSIAPVDLSGKVAIVTGANTGIGFITARELARFKAHVFVGNDTQNVVKLLLACRSADKGKQTIENIKKQIGEDAKLDFLVLDLGSMKSIREAANSFREKGVALHLLINNAGTQTCKIANK